MRDIYLCAVLCVVAVCDSSAQNINYTPLYDNTVFLRDLYANPIVGSTPASSSVTSSGAASYSIPIATPPGTNGVVPDLAIEYNSMFGNGNVGVGWRIAGLSVISRVPRNLHFDLQVIPVEMSANDRFAIDGQRLVLKSGTYGLANSTYGGEMEDFSTITAKGIQGSGPQYFEVLTKDGVVMEYGNTADSRFLDEANATVMFWRLNKIRQPDGNYIEFKYLNSDRDSRIDEVLYTGNAAAGLMPYNKVKFTYKVRGDVNTVYEGGSSVVSKYLLDKISITTEAAQLVKSYQFNYGWDNINSYLKEILETGSDGVSALNATVFKYGAPPAPFTKEAGPVLPNNQVDFFSSDFDGNGKSDLVLAHYTPYTLNTPNGLITDKKYTGFNVYRDGDKNKATGIISLDPGAQIKVGQYQSSGYSFMRADFTGDGLDDMLTSAVSTVGNREMLGNIKIYRSSLSPNGQLADALQFTATTITRTDYLYVPESRNYILSGDFDGDGKQDLFTLLEKLNANNTSAGFEAVLTKLDGNLNPANLKMVRDTDNSNVGASWASAKRLIILDFDGDGKDDIMTVAGNTCEVHTCINLAGGNSYFKKIFSSATLIKSSDRAVFAGDYNGDGKTDVLYQEYADGAQNNLPWFRLLSTGTSFVKVPFQIASANGVLVDKDILHVADFNGDGRADLYHQYKHSANQPSKVDVYYSTNNGSYTQQFTPNVDATYGLTTVPFDFNGDGRSEVVIRETGSTNLSIMSMKKGGKEHLLEKAQDGFGLKIRWQYKNMTEGAPFYTKGSVGALDYPFHNIQLPMYLASLFDNKDDGFSGQSFQYSEAKLHRRGKGFVGFKKMNELDFVSGYNTTTENEFNTNFLVSVPKQRTTTYDFDAPSVLVSKEIFTNEFVSPAANRYWVKTTTIAHTSLGGATTNTTNVFDNFGNVTKRTVNQHNVETTVTDAVYGAFPPGILNKATSVTVTKTRSGQPAFSSSSTFGYNNLGQLTSKTVFNGLPKSVSTAYEYFPLGNLKKTTVTPSGPGVSGVRSESFTYDPKGRYSLTATNPLNQTTSQTYDPKWGSRLSQTGIDGLTTSWQYDIFGRLKKTTVPEGYSIDQSYVWDVSRDGVWQMITTHPGKPDVKTWFDRLSREVKWQQEGFGGQPVTHSLTFDFRDNVQSFSLPYKPGEDVEVEAHIFDEFNRIKEVSTNLSLDVGSFTYTHSYSAGNLVTVKTRKGVNENQATTATTDPTGKIISVTDDGGTLTYSYFSHGGVKEVKSGATTLVSNTYDIYGRQSGMTDVNAGTSTYEYNALGELVAQTLPTGASSTMEYDIMGRIKQRAGSEGNATYEYYPSNSGGSTNQIKKITGFSGNLEEYTYDNLGRMQTLKETVDGTAHTTTFGYNMYGDVTSTTYPSGFGTNHAYDANGYPTTIKNLANNVTIYTNNGMNGRGQVTNYALGNGLNSTNTFEFGFPTKMETPGKQNFKLEWDYRLRLLTKRNDVLKGKTETFAYDKLDRLTTAAAGAAIQTTGYLPNGNIASKTDAGSFTYHPTRIHAVVGVTNPAPSPIPQFQQDITYTPFLQAEKISEMAAGNIKYEVDYTYGADYQRIKSVSKQNGSLTNTRYYFSSGYEKDITGASTKHLHYIDSPSGLAAIVIRENGSDTYTYIYKDHLGSISTVTNSAGTVVAEQSFDAWGRRRNPSTWTVLAPTAATGLPAWLYRGYTGHEHLDRFGLISMNGRLYDPVAGRMLSPDNVVPDAGSTQGYNRYTYAMNNPLSYTDPDGQNPLLLGILAKGALTSGLGYIMSTANRGDDVKFETGKFFQSMFNGSISAGLSFGIGEVAGYLNKRTSPLNISLFQTAAHSFVQGAVSSAEGGSFQAGLAAGLFGSLASTGTPDVGRSAFIGGLSAQANGGNFWQGAAQAGTVAAFNHLLHLGPGNKRLKVGNKLGLKGNNYFGDRYTGPNNPKDYALSPLNDRDAISMQHDKDYDLYHAAGSASLFKDGYLIPADAQFVKNQFRLGGLYLLEAMRARYPLNILFYRESIRSFGAGAGIGLSATPKFLFNNPYKY